MFKSIVVAVDLKHRDRADRSVVAAADLAKLYGASVHLVGVAGTGLHRGAQHLGPYIDSLKQYAAEQSETLGVTMAPDPVVCADPDVELHSMLMEEIKNREADLLVMASHKPGMIDHIMGGHAGYMATHAPISVLVIR